eukprot:CAMPEP_0168789200 /NCGR_PEP_ID=MMETSP0725-20121227/12728_1 /TAXON_ID=265536 /ORGANISM="Amphiprora sp., Strain CCMP467" /LENGTH=351 /DNA_ID=CAMNT_0008839499 /DNA_START=252 /DNA_END=1308 /DNA_ORIENTATION=+
MGYSNHGKEEDSGSTSLLGSTTDSPNSNALIHATVADELILNAGKLSVAMFLILLLLIYSLAPKDEIMELKSSEQDAARIAFWMMTLRMLSVIIQKAIRAASCSLLLSSMISSLGSIVTLIIPYFWGKCIGKPKPITNIFLVTLIINFTSWITNFLLGWAPVVTKMDPVLGTRVYLIRYAEWVPLAGLMTFLSDITDCPRSQGVSMPILMGVSQTVSVFAGMMFPFTNTNEGWFVWMIISVGLYLVMFPRLIHKYRVLTGTKWGDNKVDMERHERVKFSFQLIFLCSIVWTILVVMYFLNGALRNWLPEGHVFRHEALGMFVDCTFDVIAKSFYQRLLMEIHSTVFEHYAS